VGAEDLVARFQAFRERARALAREEAAMAAVPAGGLGAQPLATVGAVAVDPGAGGGGFRLVPGVGALATRWPSRLAGAELGAPANWRLLDLETTGLHGAGARAFLAAVGRLVGDGVEVRQVLLPDLDREGEFLTELLTALEGATAVVTFNGKAFDWPLLRDRCLLAGLGARWRELPHWDVLFAARRLYGGCLGSCELGHLSAVLLGEAREGEPDGAAIPRLYQAYLQGDRSALDGVLRRNRRDVWALAGVAARLAGALEGPPDPEAGAAALLGLGRQLERLGEWERALYCYRVGAGPALRGPRGLPPVWPLERNDFAFADSLARREAAEAAARLLKRLGRHEEAAALWDRSRRGPLPALNAAVELAKFLEHRRRDPAAALSVVQEALRAAPWMSAERRAALQHRAERLARKASRPGGAGSPQGAHGGNGPGAGLLDHS
jgi:tetratricopeptide (TPR) repeat protein